MRTRVIEALYHTLKASDILYKFDNELCNQLQEISNKILELELKHISIGNKNKVPQNFNLQKEKMLSDNLREFNSREQNQDDIFLKIDSYLQDMKKKIFDQGD